MVQLNRDHGLTIVLVTLDPNIGGLARIVRMPSARSSRGRPNGERRFRSGRRRPEPVAE